MRTGASRAAATIGLAALWTAAVAAGTPAAIVESVQGPVAGVEFMDYVTPGQVIRLGGNGSLVLGYLASCWRETITGGTVIVGEQQSRVDGGRVQRARVACDAGRLQLGAREAAQSAATVFRGLPGAAPPLLLHGRSPAIEVGAERGTLVIERIDDQVERIELPLAGEALRAGHVFDLATAGVELSAGATYAASCGTKRAEFAIARDATRGAAPLVGRLVSLE